MKYIFFILLILSMAFIYFYYNRKLELLKKQLIITRKQYSILKNKYSNKSTGKLLVKFSIPKYKSATLKSNTNVYLSPIPYSCVLRKIDFITEIGILDCAEINNETWFYINIPSNDGINSRGWVTSKDISLFYSNSSSINNSITNG